MKKAICMILTLVLLLSVTACAQKPKNSSIDDIDLQQMLYLFDDMTGMELARFCTQQGVTAQDVAGVIGADQFDLPFEAARALQPMMSSSAFVLVVFRLAEGADTDAFAKALEEKANPNMWICVGAEAVETATQGRTVLFVMSSRDQAATLIECFNQMGQPDFRPEDHLIDRLDGLTMEALYQKLYAEYSVEMYGFLDGEDCAAVSADTGFGLSKMPQKQYTDSHVDSGYFPAEEYDGERSYLLVMFRLAKGVDSDVFARELEACVDTSALKGGDVQTVTAWSEDVVIFYAGGGSLGWCNSSLEMAFRGTYRMETAGVEPWY